MRRWSLLLALIFSLGACSQPPAPPALTDERFGAPMALTPRDVRPIAADPCSGPLTPSDWRDLGFAPSGVLDTVATGERSCAREGPNTERYAALVIVANRDVLVDTYRTRQFAIFRPAEIGGLPATVEQSAATDVSCSITVGTADGQGFVLDYSEYGFTATGQPNDPCGRGLRVAERIVGALPPLAGK
jgi:hypothetical protein